jgi:hypothetical protein
VSEALEMTTADRDWFLERIGRQRSREAHELAKASKPTTPDSIRK